MRVSKLYLVIKSLYFLVRIVYLSLNNFDLLLLFFTFSVFLFRFFALFSFKLASPQSSICA